MDEPNIVGNFEDGCLDAMAGSIRVGYIWFVHQNDRSILLSDIHVFDHALISRGGLAKWIPWLHPKLACYRNQGVGRALMTKFLRCADNELSPRIYGFLTPRDLAESPFLVTWYTSFGFALLPPDRDSLPNAVHKIERSLHH